MVTSEAINLYPIRESFSVLDFVQSLWRRKWLIAGITIGLGLLNTIAVLTLPTVYRADALLQVDELTSKSDLRGIPPNLDGGLMASQLDVIRSPSVALAVINSQNLYRSPEFRRHFDVGPGLTIAIRDAVARLLPGALSVELLRLTNHPIDTSMLERRRRDDAIRLFESQLDVDYDLRGTSIWIRYRSRDPVVAASVANAVADTYVRQQMSAKLEMLKGTNEWLNQRLDALRRKAQESESRLALFRQQNNLGTDEAPSFLSQRLSDLNKHLVDATAAADDSYSRLKQAELAAQSGRLSEFADSTENKAILFAREQQIRLAHEQAAAEIGGNRILEARVSAELSNVQRKLTSEIARTLGSIRDKAIVAQALADNIKKAISDVQAQADKRQQAYVQAGVLAHEATADRTVFDAVVQQAEETRTLNGLQHPDIRLLAAAQIPGWPHQPQLRLLIPLGLVAALVIAVAVAMILEFRKPLMVRTMEAGELLLGITGLGWIPAIRRRRPTSHELTVEVSPNPVNEAFRILALSVRAWLRRDGGVVLVTSAISGEGKSSAAVGLARTIALAGHSCLLIDADLRRPKAAAMLGAGRPGGLAAVGLGELALEQAVQIDQKTGLTFLAAGTTREDPFQSFADEERLRAVIDAARTRYSVVVIDSPPVLSVPDAAILARSADLTLVVVAWNSTPVKLIRRAIARLRESETGLGFILSKVNEAALGRYDVERYGIAYRDFPRRLEAPLP